jgi:lipopolysaccharide export system permease protein
MIVNKHFKKELTYNTVSITLVLLVTLILYAFIRYVKYIIEGKIPMGYIFELIGLELPNTLGLLLCAGLSLGLIVTISRMHAQKELIIWLTSGVSIKKMLLIFLRHILLFCFIIGILSMWLAPHSLTRLHHIKSKLSSSILSSFIVPGQFSKLGQTNQVLFAEDNKKDNTVSVFVADIDKNKLNTIITAKSIKVEEKKILQF